MRYEIQIRWGLGAIRTGMTFPTRADAEWAVAKWRQENDCRGDPFRVVGVEPNGEAIAEAAASSDAAPVG